MFYPKNRWTVVEGEILGCKVASDYFEVSASAITKIRL